MPKNHFFEKKGPFPLKEIIKFIGCKESNSNINNIKVHGFDSLVDAKDSDMTFLNSSKYKEDSLNTKALACLTTSNLTKYLPKKCIALDVKNVFFAVTQVSNLFYPNAAVDLIDPNLKDAKDLNDSFPNVNFGTNVLIGKNVLIGEKTSISSNTIIESNVIIGKNCFVGSFVTIKNSFIKDNVYIQEGSKIGIKGFGFIPIKNKNIRSPHIGKVILEDGVEVGANSTIDRGSLSDTIIGKNTFLDNQVHIAHNVKIGANCMIAGQVGFAGSATIGDNVVIGGQAGVSGHIKVGNNVKIGGGSGVINDIPDNTSVMGYPAVPLKEFIRQRKK
tara:strand:- start:216 stop:1208 length:993 start_codon:yes stop_codon:yes gene_type:complete